MRRIPILLFCGVVISILIDAILYHAQKIVFPGQNIAVGSVLHSHIVESGTSPTVWNPTSIMQIIVTLAFTVASLYVVISKRYEADDRNWAYGALGTILGFWLHAASN
jgi:hypothetical protein